jgi:hypothetical protein
MTGVEEEIVADQLPGFESGLKHGQTQDIGGHNGATFITKDSVEDFGFHFRIDAGREGRTRFDKAEARQRNSNDITNTNPMFNFKGRDSEFLRK